MQETQDLTILWTTADPLTANFMVLQYATNCLTQDWWDSVTVVLWGASLKLVAKDAGIQEHIRAAAYAGVRFSACKAAARQLGVTGEIEQLDIPLEGWGHRLSQLLQKNTPVLTI